jgi:hypothetical protein
MLILFVTACLWTAPNDCQRVSLGLTFETPMACLMASQPASAEWARWHPKYSVKRVRCERPGKEA